MASTAILASSYLISTLDDGRFAVFLRVDQCTWFSECMSGHRIEYDLHCRSP
ncbi:hypothetical protein PISMIDRAFT_673488 [Pisolithus microcarpus 441]|uniref:Uncharacterized protein n=1 Tax=Pisolithus microcarpus 441 TaxID=765257 RepID=A0A0C9YU60_9AGAM|nr:hypothetical protein PISMIDRAFT_673488 [Pisolithus microcarpus 441]